MKRTLFAGWTALALSAGSVLAQPSPLWENWGTITDPGFPIDAVSVWNHKGATLNSADLVSLFNTFDTLNYTNQGLLVGNPGFDFEYIPSQFGGNQMAANFVNQASGLGSSSGVIDCSGLFQYLVGTITYGNLSGSSRCLVSASNIVNSGTITMDASSLIRMTGYNLDLSRGAMVMANPIGFTEYYQAGILDGYWGVGDASPPPFVFGTTLQPLMNPDNLRLGFTPEHRVTPRNYQGTYEQLFLASPQDYMQTYQFGPSNLLVQAVVMQTASPLLASSVYLAGSEIAVQWQWVQTNWPDGAISTNYLVLRDDFGEVTNLYNVLDGAAGPRSTYIPYNFQFAVGTPYSSFNPFTSPSPTAVLPFGAFGTGTATNQFSAYEAIFSAATALTTDTAGGNVTNLAGRIELNAMNKLDLTGARVTALNYLLLNATNHFVGSKNAQISSPHTDLRLRTTNAVLAVTNMIAPYLNHLDGTCQLYSARWTNVVAGITNSYHVLVVDAEMSPIFHPDVQTLDLTVTNAAGADNNLFISDILNVTRDLKLRAERLTITTNQFDQFNPFGQLNILSPDIVWSTAAPGLRYLTNWGIITAPNVVYFGGSRTSQYYTNVVDVPYEALVNHGEVFDSGSQIFAKYFENNGIFYTGEGTFNLQNGTTVLLTNGTIYAGGDLLLTAQTMLVSNSVLQAGGALTLAVTNYLDDSSFGPFGPDGVTNKNFWIVGNGINLPVLPARGSLLGTTIESEAADYAVVENRWAAPDLGPDPAAFSNNAAIGRLILQGNAGCEFHFTGTGAANAMYVDTLDLRGSAGRDVDPYGNFLALSCAPNMKVYFGQALANGRSIAEKLSLVNDSRFIWVSNYTAGFFCSTNLVYADGTTNRLNTALVTSCDIDSNGNGIPNCSDPSPVPILSPAGLALSVVFAPTPAPAAQVSWKAFPMTINALYAAPSANSTNWLLVTNFLYSGPFPDRVVVSDVIKTNGPRFYRVKVNSQ